MNAVYRILKENLKFILISVFVGFLSFSLLFYPKMLMLMHKGFKLSDTKAAIYLLFYLSVVGALILYYPLEKLYFDFLYNINFVVLTVLFPLSLYIDLHIISHQTIDVWLGGLNVFLITHVKFYSEILLALSVLIIWEFENKDCGYKKIILLLISIVIPSILLIPFLKYLLLIKSGSLNITFGFPVGFLNLVNILSCIFLSFGVFILYKEFSVLPKAYIKVFLNSFAFLSVSTFLIELFILIYPHYSFANVKSHVFSFLPLVMFFILLNSLRFSFKKKAEVKPSRDVFGSATFAAYKDLKKLHAYDSKIGIIIGSDFKNNLLYLPLKNKLTIAPPGLGKTVSSTIPVLLSYDGPILALDVKGELHAVTARFRQEVLKREVIVIDPFRITHTENSCHFNPFDTVPEDVYARDRMINAFAASFIVDEGQYTAHFDENARILIRGYIDYMMSLPREERCLSVLYHLHDLRKTE